MPTNNRPDNLIAELIAAGVSSPRLEAMMILESAKFDDIPDIIKRRKEQEPLDKILGYRDFYKYRFCVSHDVLSPRPDSETLVEEAIGLAKQYGFKSLLELGVGSGCLILSMLSDIPTMSGTGIDKSAMALAIAGQNARALGLSDRVQFVEADYFGHKPDNKFDMIISNPPYIPSHDINQLDVAVKKYDPILALDGGEDGLEHYRRLAQIVPDLLHDNGYFLAEIGINQHQDVKAIFADSGLSFVEIKLDLAGIERCIIYKK